MHFRKTFSTSHVGRPDAQVKIPVGNNRRVSSRLSGIPVVKRRRLAATLGLFAALFAAVGAVAATGRTSAAAPVFAAIAVGVALLLALVAWGVVNSVRTDEAEARLDAAIEATIAAQPGRQQFCDCGHEHDPDELHVSEACEHDGTGAACAHDCQSCVLGALRPSPTATREQRATR